MAAAEAPEVRPGRGLQGSSSGHVCLQTRERLEAAGSGLATSAGRGCQVLGVAEVLQEAVADIGVLPIVAQG